MRNARPPPFRFSLGRNAQQQQQQPQEQRSLLPQQDCALARFNLRPATVAFGPPPRPGYACLSASQTGAYSGDESDDEGAVLPQRNCCHRCCLVLCVLALMAGGTGIVLRFLLARDAHPSSPAAVLASRGRSPPKLSLRGPKSTWKSNRTALLPALRSPPPPSPRRPHPPSPPMIGLDDAPPPWSPSRPLLPPTFPTPPPLFMRPGPPLPPPPPRRDSPPWPPSPPARNQSSDQWPPSPFKLPVVTVRHSVPYWDMPGPKRSPPPSPSPSPPLPLREPGLLPIPAVAARVAARNDKRRAKNQTLQRV